MGLTETTDTMDGGDGKAERKSSRAASTRTTGNVNGSQDSGGDADGEGAVSDKEGVGVVAPTCFDIQLRWTSWFAFG